ncbi:hypothetical protein FBU30_001545, partial [Linnemannia zychae]
MYKVYYESKANVIKYSDCPQDFWAALRHDPSLSIVAAIAPSYLVIQATSSASERAFSRAGLILDKKSASMSDSNFHNIICAQSYALVLPIIEELDRAEKRADFEKRQMMSYG